MGQCTLREVRNGSKDPQRDPGRVGGTALRSETGPGTL